MGRGPEQRSVSVHQHRYTQDSSPCQWQHCYRDGSQTADSPRRTTSVASSLSRQLRMSCRPQQTPARYPHRRHFKVKAPLSTRCAPTEAVVSIFVVIMTSSNYFIVPALTFRTYRITCRMQKKKKHTEPYPCTKCPRVIVDTKDRDRHLQPHDPSLKFQRGFPGCEFQATPRDSLTSGVGAKHAVKLPCWIAI